jgi:two-component system, LuxR family, response regulator FixJ
VTTPPIAPEPSIFIVDDDAAARDSLALLLSLKGFRTLTFARAEDFLATFREEWCGCILVDVRMPGMDGLTLQRELKLRNIKLPVIVMTAHGDVATARHALRAGAIDYLEKPLDDHALGGAIDEALAFRVAAKVTPEKDDLSRLTRREREVMDLLVEGLANREIANQLDISPRTVEVYKARLMEKLNVKGLAELIRMVLHNPFKSTP